MMTRLRPLGVKRQRELRENMYMYLYPSLLWKDYCFKESSSSTATTIVRVTLDRNLNFYYGACHKGVVIIRRLRIWKNFVKYKNTACIKILPLLRWSVSNYGNFPVEEIGVYKPSKEGFAEFIEFEVVS